MVATTKRQPTRQERIERIRRHLVPPVRTLTREEGRRLFDHRASELLGISGEEFLRRWDAGEYRGVPDSEEGRKINRLVMLIPFARRTPV